MSYHKSKSDCNCKECTATRRFIADHSEPERLRARIRELEAKVTRMQDQADTWMELCGQLRQEYDLLELENERLHEALRAAKEKNNG